MAIGAFVEGPAGGAGYNGRVTSFVVLSCIVAGSGGILFGYDLGISGTSSFLHYASAAIAGAARTEPQPHCTSAE
jgi:hypothetical protein